jgi:hypothetical protein
MTAPGANPLTARPVDDHDGSSRRKRPHCRWTGRTLTRRRSATAEALRDEVIQVDSFDAAGFRDGYHRGAPQREPAAV